MDLRLRAHNAARKVVTRILDLEIRSRTVGTTTLCRRVTGFENVTCEGHNHIAEGVRFAGTPITLGIGTSIHTNALLQGPLTIGNYCQLGPRVAAFPADHPVERVTPYTGDALFGGELSQFMATTPITVGHGVWIGANAVLLRGTTVGDGAVIGAGAVVSGDVPRYAIVAGNPARVVRTRLTAEAREIIDTSRWWLLSPAALEPYREFLEADLVGSSATELEDLRQIARSMSTGVNHDPG